MQSLNNIVHISILFHFYLESVSRLKVDPANYARRVRDRRWIKSQISLFLSSGVSTSSFNLPPSLPLFRSARGSWLRAVVSLLQTKKRREREREKEREEEEEECKSSLTSPSNIRFRIEWEFQSEPPSGPTTQISFIASKRLRSVVCLNCYT